MILNQPILHEWTWIRKTNRNQYRNRKVHFQNQAENRREANHRERRKASVPKNPEANCRTRKQAENRK